MDLGPGAVELEPSSCCNRTHGNPTGDEDQDRDRDLDLDLDLDPVVLWVPSGRRLISGLLGMNVVLLGAALVGGQVLNPEKMRHQEPQVFVLVLMGAGLIWLLWYLLWARNQPGISPHQDHHAGGTTVICVLLLFSGFSVLVLVFRIGYLVSVRECQPAAAVLSAFVEAPFLILQTYLLWAHSKDCVHKHKIITRSGLMLLLSCDLLLWLSAVTEDTIHQEVELERSQGLRSNHSARYQDQDLDQDQDWSGNGSRCRCSASASCLIFRKGFEIFYPFNMEFYLMASCMIYVLWKNVGRRLDPGHHPHPPSPSSHPKLTLRTLTCGGSGGGGLTVGPAAGGLVLASGVTVFVLYQVWLTRPELRRRAFLTFYGFHLAAVPVMALCSLAGLLVQRLERRAREAGHNPTRSLDVLLLVAAALGQLALSYFSLVAALALGGGGGGDGGGGGAGPLAHLDLSYSLVSLMELLLQNVFIIQGLHRHPSLLAQKKEQRRWRPRRSLFKSKKKVPEEEEEEKKVDLSLLQGSAAAAAVVAAPPAAQVHDGKPTWHKRVTQEICAFLLLSNIMLWVIPAFGAHPQLENGLGKEFFGLSTWFVLVNVGQPLAVFYRMHSVGALMELMVSA